MDNYNSSEDLLTILLSQEKFKREQSKEDKYFQHEENDKNSMFSRNLFKPLKP